MKNYIGFEEAGFDRCVESGDILILVPSGFSEGTVQKEDIEKLIKFLQDGIKASANEKEKEDPRQTNLIDMIKEMT